MSIKLIYTDIPPEIVENVTSVSGSYYEENLSSISLERAHKYLPNAFIKYATLEDDYWLLDGTFDLISKQSNLTDSEKPCLLWGEFSYPSTYYTTRKSSYTRTWDENYSSPGITVIFGGDAYPDSITITWYSGDTSLSSKTYTPDNFTYFCENAVTGFNKITITINSMNKSGRYAKLIDISDGRIVEFGAADLAEIRIYEELNVTSEAIGNNQLTATILQKDTDLNYTFQNTQTINAYNDDKLYGTFFVTKNERTGKYKFSITAQDYKGLLDNTIFNGAIYDNETVSDIVKDIIGDAIPYQIDDIIASKYLKGAIPKGTKRDALTAVLLAAQAICDTSRKDYLHITKLTVNPILVDTNRTFYGKGSYKTDNMVTSVKLTTHKYVERATAEQVYKDTLSIGTYTTEFSDPIDVSTVSISGATISTISAYTCTFVVSTTGTVIITANIYDDYTTVVAKDNPNLVSGVTDNVHEVSNYTTLVSPDIASDVLNHLMDYYATSTTLESKIHIQNEVLGDTLILNTDWLGNKTGIVEKMDYSIKGKAIGKVTLHTNG